MQYSRVFHKVKAWIDDYLSHPKIANLLIGLICFFSATQLGFHFWPNTTLVYGVRVDYLSPTIYFLDLLIILYLVIKRSDLVGCKSNQNPTRSDLVGVILPLLLANLLFSQNPLATLSWSLHFLLYLVFVCTLRFSDIRYTLPAPLGLAVLFQVFLALAQVLLGHTVQGPLYYLGERALAVGQPGIASAQIFGQTMLRAYGTFSHPNVLAGWLVVSLLTIRRLMLQSKRNSLLWLTTAQIVIGVFLTQSRAAALSLFGFVIPLFLLRPKFRLPYYLVSLLGCLMFYAVLLSPARADFSLRERLALQNISLQVISRSPIFGTGASASIPAAVPLTKPLGITGLQPDHDSLTLFLSWFGLVGALGFICTMASHGYQRLTINLLPLLPLLLFDHYLLTSPQGLFILLLYLRAVTALH